MALMQIKLVRVDVLGIYGKSGDAFPRSASLLHPDAAAAFVAACRNVAPVRCSDVFRSPEQSLAARAQKSGVQPPGFSAHNFGLAIDVDQARMMRDHNLTKPALDQALAAYGWHCHRRDGVPGAFESWHYNFLGQGAAEKPFLALANRTTAPAAEAKILELYGEAFQLDPVEAQTALASLNLYRGEADGILGPRSKAAISAFQRSWELPATGELDQRTQRTLATVSAQLQITETT